ncbi:MAG: hypothetical protein ACI3X1_01605 [Eubacteriales bacterium]
MNIACWKLFVRFFFDSAGAKKKLGKKKTPRVISPRARGDQGYAPWMGAAF